MDELGCHSANAIVSQIVEQLRNEYTHSVETSTLPEASMNNPETSLPRQTTEVNSDYTDVPTAPTANAIQQADPAMATLMLTMMANVEDMRLRMEGNKRQGGYGTGYHNGRGCRRCRGHSRGIIYTGRRRGRGRSE